MNNFFKTCLPFFTAFAFLTYLVSENAFFWDTLLQAAKHADFYYQNNFSQLILPFELDAGHPPFFGVYLAFVWKLFGKSLLVSHWAMLPWLFGIVWQLYRLIQYFFSEKDHFLVLLVVFSNVTLLGQSSLVSPDIALLFFFLFSVNGILYQKKWQIIFGTIGMGLLSIRAIVLIALLFAYQVYVVYLQEKRILIKNIGTILFTFAPVMLISGGFYLYHFIETGWWLSTPNESWNAHRELVTFSGIFKKIAVLAWRLLDFGMIAVWIVFAGLVIKFFKRRNLDLKTKQLFGLPLIILFAFLPLFLFLSNPIAHRYLMPIMLTFSIAVCFLIFKIIEKRITQIMIIAFIVLVQFSGNFWVYPKHVAQGWDSTLAHLPYYGLRLKMIEYLDKNEILIETVGTEFPMTGSMEYLDLNNRKEGFHKKEIDQDLYILYSNVFNDFSDMELTKLTANFDVEKEFRSGQICMILYKRIDK